MKIAVLISRSSGSRTLLRFGETVAKNKGPGARAPEAVIRKTVIKNPNKSIM